MTDKSRGISSTFSDVNVMDRDQSGMASLDTFDESAYLPYLDDLEFDDAQKREFLRILWNMMRLFVEMNIPAESWGQIVEEFSKAAAHESAGIN